MLIKTGVILITGLLMAQPVGALIVDFTLSGTVASLQDTANAFGGANAGDPFILVFRADTSLGRYAVGAGGSGNGSNVFGGTRYTGTPDAAAFPGIVVSPVAAMLTINGRSQAFSGSYYGNASLSNSFGPHGGGVSDGDLRAQGPVTSGAFGGVSTIDATLFSNVVAPFPLITQPFTFIIDGGQTFATVSFSQVLSNNATHRDIETAGSLNATRLVAGPAAAIPEPASWVMVLAGFAVVGGVLRRRTDTTKVVAA